MPHSTQRSKESIRTFDLATDERPGTTGSDHTMKSRSRPTSSAYGVAVTSPTPVVGEPAKLPPAQQQQQRSDSGDLNRLRRRSTPGTAEDYAIADMLAQRSNLEELVRANDGRSYSYNDAAKRKTQYYEDQFQYKENAVTQTRERGQRQTPVIAELKTNVIIKDEFTLVTDLSYQLAQRYTRPDSCIMVKVDHSACLAMGSTFDPCYLLSVQAVQSQMGPSTNKRNAALIQAFMADILSVPAERGIITFVPMPEENLATGGTTVLGEMEKAEKQGRSSGLKTTLNDAARKSMTFNKRSTPTPDAEVNGNSNGHLQNGVPIEKKSSQESSDGSIQIERPRTAHGTGSSPVVNGLRMNPISADELRATQSERLPNGRPKSVGAPIRSSTSDNFKHEPIPNVVRQASQLATARAAVQAATQTRPQPVKTKSAMKTQNHTPLAPRPVQVQPNAFTTSSITTPFTQPMTSTKVSSATKQVKKDKAVYLDMVTALPPKPDASISVSELETTKTETAAATNTAKRRSATMTAATTPKIPQIPPSIPSALDETRSVNSKLSKRKSIMRMFKRESRVEPWFVNEWV